MFSRFDLIESEESNIFFVYDAIDSSDLRKRYLLTLHTVRADGTKFRINIFEEEIVFFDIKIQSEDMISEYNYEFSPDYYELFKARPFDSTKEYQFIRLFYLSLNNRKKALDKIIEKEKEIKKRYEEKKKELKRSFSDERNFELQELFKRYDTYSDANSCYYRKVAYEKNFRLV